MSGPGEWLRRVRTAFDEALQTPPAKREAWLATLDPRLRKELIGLLAAAPEAGAVLEPRRAKPGDLTGQRLGAYQLLGLIGAGGMASVFEARHPEDGRRVAIKLIRPGLVRDVTLRRFRQEQWILGSLAHPHIAALVDTGVAPDERPFLVMEYIAGAPITDWCDDRKLGLAARIALFRQACEAVAHANAQGILHRDLKPDNILVAEGGVKLLDFGIAKLLQEEPALEAIRTSLGSRALTPEYASPEQIAGDPLTPATDVYSLGVVLFELLTGRLPHERGAESLLEFTQRARTQVPPAPSERVGETAARIRGIASAEALRKQLAGLDQLVLRALAKDPRNRYASAGAFGDSLGKAALSILTSRR